MSESTGNIGVVFSFAGNDFLACASEDDASSCIGFCLEVRARERKV